MLAHAPVPSPANITRLASSGARAAAAQPQVHRLSEAVEWRFTEGGQGCLPCIAAHFVRIARRPSGNHGQGNTQVDRGVRFCMPPQALFPLG